MKTLTSVFALMFALMLGTSSVFAAEPGSAPAAKKDPVAEACKGKKAGDTVKVDGKDVKCPEAKKK